jgi:hypothetical protein
MAIKPIDLQVLFAQMNRVGEQQAAHKNVLLQGQAVVGSEIAQKSEQIDHEVNETETIEEGPEPVHEEEGREQAREREQREKEKEKQEKADKEFFQDPDLGQNIDISG